MDSAGNNRYELLFADEDASAPVPVEIITKKKQPVAAAAPKKAPAPKKSEKEKENKANIPNKNTVKKPSANMNDSGAHNANVGRYQEGGRHYGEKPEGEVREQRYTPRYPREGGNDYNNDQRTPRQFKDNRGPPRNRNFGEGSYRGKREFDRQSGSDRTGIKSVDKRDGAGAHNWGSVKQEIDDINQTNTSDGNNATSDKEEAVNEQQAETNVTMADEEDEEEEAKEMTLDEWKALRQQREKPKYNIRQPGEGEDTSQWKKMVVLTKKKEVQENEEELEYDPSMYPQRVGRLQRIVDIQFNFTDDRRGGFNRFGRGRGRGRGGAPGSGGRFENNRYDNNGRFDKERNENAGGRYEKDRSENTGGRYEKDRSEYTGGRYEKDRSEYTGGRYEKDRSEYSGGRYEKDRSENTGGRYEKDRSENAGRYEKYGSDNAGRYEKERGENGPRYEKPRYDNNERFDKEQRFDNGRRGQFDNGNRNYAGRARSFAERRGGGVGNYNAPKVDDERQFPTLH